MRLPFITRKKHELEVLKVQKLVAFVPVEYPSIDGKPVQIPRKGYCYHDKRIGWVQAVEFKDYDEYTKFLKEINNESK